MITLSVLESTQVLLPSRMSSSPCMTVESWFSKCGVVTTRTELYKSEDGSVVAYQECCCGKWGPLHIERNFLELNKEEDSVEAILKYSGVFDLKKVQTFDLGR